MDTAGKYDISCDHPDDCDPLGTLWVVATNLTIGDTSCSTPVPVEIPEVTIARGGSVDLSLGYAPGDLKKGSLTLSGLDGKLEVIDKETGAKVSPTTWSLENGNSIPGNLALKAVKAGETMVTWKHTTSGAESKIKVVVAGIDIIIDGVDEDNEENPGAFIGHKKEKTLEIQAVPKSNGGNVTLTLSEGLKLCIDGNEKVEKTWTWNVNSIPSNLTVKGDLPSQTMCDRKGSVSWGNLSDIALATVISGNLAADSLTDFNIGTRENGHAYVHWNIDDDDNSATSNSTDKHPGGDYLQDHVPGENDLKSLGLGLAPANISAGTVRLTVGAKAKLWKSATKGSTNLVLASGAKSWNLAIEAERNDFNAVKSSLFVEGTDGGGPEDFKWEYTPPVGSQFELDKVKYQFIAANCGSQPTVVQKNAVLAMLPRLEGCEWSVLPSTQFYNCIAHSVGVFNLFFTPVINVPQRVIVNGTALMTDDYREIFIESGITYVSIDKRYGNSDNVFTDVGNNNDIDAFYNAFGLTPSATSASDAEVIYYSNFHAAKRRNCNCGSPKWLMFESKGGSGMIIEHRIDQITGGGFGNPIRYYKR